MESKLSGGIFGGAPVPGAVQLLSPGVAIMPSMQPVGDLLVRMWSVFARVFPRCSVISQAIAFNLFLAFFPTLLLIVGVASTWLGTKTALLETTRNLTDFLPPGSQTLVTGLLARQGISLWQLVVVGWVGTLFGGTQVMKLLMDGIHLIYEDEEKIGFVHRQLRGLLLLVITIAPLMIAAILGVFGRPLRHWLTDQFGQRLPVHGMWLIFFPAVAMSLAMLALGVIYWVARPKEKSLREVLPGAALATLLWWLVNAAFGVYVRRVPYNVVYGGLAAVIGLLLWMQISSVIVFLGAAWNAETAASRK
jgi:membrane protein